MQEEKPKLTVTINTVAGAFEIPAIAVYKQVCIHYRFNTRTGETYDRRCGYCVSHLKAGKIMARFKKLADAKNLAKDLEKLDLDFGEDVYSAENSDRRERLYAGLDKYANYRMEN